MILWRFLAAVSFAVVYGDLNDNFDDFILRYGRPYIRGSPEYAYRMSVFNVSFSILLACRHSIDSDDMV